jgi:hypothetical protein
VVEVSAVSDQAPTEATGQERLDWAKAAIKNPDVPCLREGARILLVEVERLQAEFAAQRDVVAALQKIRDNGWFDHRRDAYIVPAQIYRDLDRAAVVSGTPEGDAA